MNSECSDLTQKAADLVVRTEQEPELFKDIDPRLPALVHRLNSQFPNDVGLFCGCLLLNHVHLNPGEAIFYKLKNHMLILLVILSNVWLLPIMLSELVSHQNSKMLKTWLKC